MAGTGRPGRPKGSKNKPRVTSTSAPKADNLSASSSLDTGLSASSINTSKQPSDTFPVPPRSSLPPSVLASLERPSVTNYARNHPMFSASEKVSEKKYLKEVKAFASAKDVSEDFVNSCVAEAQRLLDERRTETAAAVKHVEDVTARADEDHGHRKKRKKHETKDNGEEEAGVIKHEKPKEPVKEKRKKHKMKDEQSASVSTQHKAAKQKAKEPAAENEKPKKHTKKQKSSDGKALAQDQPAAQAGDADGKKAKKQGKGKAPETAARSASAAKPAVIASEVPPIESKRSKKKHKSQTESKSADASEHRPIETPIPLPTAAKSEAQKSLEVPASKSQPSNKRKREQSDDGSSKPALDEAEASKVGHASNTKKEKKKKKHGKSEHESDPKAAEVKKDKKKKHKNYHASRPPSPPPRKKTKRVQHDDETTHLASEAPQSGHKSHEHADKGKGKKDKKSKQPNPSETPQPGLPKSAASERGEGGSGDERPIHVEGNAPTPGSSKKKHKKKRKKTKMAEHLEEQLAEPSKAMDVDSGSDGLGPEPEAQSEKHSKKAKRGSLAAREALATLPFAGAQDSPAKPSKSGSGQLDSKSATSLPPPPPKRKRSPSPLSDDEPRPNDTRKQSLASTTSVFSLPTLTRFAKDSLVLPEPPEGMTSGAKRRWRKKMRQSMQKVPNVALHTTREKDDNPALKAPVGAEIAKFGDESDCGRKPNKKKAKVEHKSDERPLADDAVSKAPDVLRRRPDSPSQPATTPRPMFKRPQVTATGSFAQEDSLSPIHSPERSGLTHEQGQDSTSEEATGVESNAQKPQVPATGGFAHDEPPSSPERPGSVHKSPAPPAASDSPLKSDIRGWNTLPAQYLSDSDQEAQDDSEVEPDAPIEPARPSQLQQTGDEDADTESSKDLESETESENDSESEAEGPFKPRPQPPNLFKTPSQISTPSQRPLPPPASLRAQPLLLLSQLKASTPTLATTRAAVPLKPKTPPKPSGNNVDILGISHGTDDSDEESSESSSSSDDDDGDRKKNAKANTTKPPSLHFPTSQAGKALLELKTPLLRKPASAVREPSVAPEKSTARTAQPLADLLDSNAGSGDSDESASASSDDGNDKHQRAARLSSNRTTPHVQSLQTSKTNSPERSLSERDELRVDNVALPQENDDEASSESKNDNEQNGTSTSIDFKPVSRQARGSQQTELELPRSSKRASRSPRQMPTEPFIQSDESTKDDAQVEEYPDPAESRDEVAAHAEVNDATDMVDEPQTIDGQADKTNREHSRSPSAETADPTPFESARQTPAQHSSPGPRQDRVGIPVRHAPRSPSTNDIINGIALSGPKKASSVEPGSLHEKHQSPADSEAHELPNEHISIVDEDTEADSDAKSLNTPEKSNHGHSVSTNYDEPDNPLDSPTPRRSTSTRQRRSSLVAASTDNNHLKMGQEVSAAKLDDVSIPAGPPLAEGEEFVASYSSSSSLRNRSGHSRVREQSASPTESDLRAKSHSPPCLVRNRAGQFCRRDGSSVKKVSNRKPRPTPRPKSNNFILKELGIDPDTYRADEPEEHDEDIPVMPRGSQRSSAEESRESPLSTRWPRLRATPRVSYQDGYDSSESVTATAARRLSFTSKKTRSPVRRRSSQTSCRTQSPILQSDNDLPPKVESPLKKKSAFVGVFIPAFHQDESTTSPTLRDGKSATPQDEQVVASTADADQTNDEDVMRKRGTPPLPSGDARDDDSVADDKSTHERDASQDFEAAENEQDRVEDDESMSSGYKSPERPVFTVSFPVHSAPHEAPAHDVSASEYGEEIDGAESDVAQSDSTQQKSPVPEKRDSGIDEKVQDPFRSPKAEFEGQDQDEPRDHGRESRQSGIQESSNEDQVSEAVSRGSDYSFDDEPNGFVNEDGTVSGQATPRHRTGLRSNHFSPTKPSRLPAGTTRLPFPSTMTDEYGLIQEKLSDEPLRLLVVNMLLNKTKANVAIPKFWEIMEKYPTVDDLSHANMTDLIDMIQPLGLQSRRADSMIKLAKFWINDPPRKGRRHRKPNYPFRGAHQDIRAGEILSDEDSRVAAFEICHLPNVGSYALDTWRIFCRDQLRERATGFNGEDAEPGFEPEWKRVVPTDKELKGFLRWMWLREGWIWDPETGEKKRASEDEALAATLARLRWDQGNGQAYMIGEDTPHGSLPRKEGDGPEDYLDDKMQASRADSSPSSHFPSPTDDPSSQLEREQRNRAAQSQLAQTQLLREQQQQHLTVSQPLPSKTADTQRTPKANAQNGTMLTAPATLPTRLRRTTTTSTTSTSSSPVSAYRHKPTPLDLFSDDDDNDNDDDSASNLGLRSLFKTPPRRRGSSAKWAASGVVDETPVGSPQPEEQHQNGTGSRMPHDNYNEHDVDHFSIFGGDRDDNDDQNHKQRDTDQASRKAKAMNGHREVREDQRDDDDDDDDEGKRLHSARLQEDEADIDRVEGKEGENESLPSGVDTPPAAGDGSQESNKSCCIM